MNFVFMWETFLELIAAVPTTISMTLRCQAWSWRQPKALLTL